MPVWFRRASLVGRLWRSPWLKNFDLPSQGGSCLNGGCKEFRNGAPQSFYASVVLSIFDPNGGGDRLAAAVLIQGNRQSPPPGGFFFRALATYATRGVAIVQAAVCGT